MAQADPETVRQLQTAILNICPLPRGCRNFSEIFKEAIPNITVREGREVVKTLHNLLDEHVFNSASNYFDNEPPFQLENIVFSGSFSEGTHKLNLQAEVTSDTDFLLTLKNIIVSEEDQRQGNLKLKEDSPFVNLYLSDEELIKTWTEFLETSNEPQSQRNTMLSSKKLKERFRKKYVESGPMITLLNNEDVKKTDDGPSIEVNSYIPRNEKLTSHQPMPFSTSLFDFVLAIKCDGWPLCAQEWTSRLRRWPTQDIVQNIVRQGFHIVCKSSSEGNFRLSFSNAETLLIGNLTDLQHKTYRAFKSFIGHYKSEWSPNVKKIFCSYHLKTIVLWYCEKCDLKDWHEDTVVCHLLSLIDELIIALKRQSLPMYFMPKYNLMEKMEDGTDVAEKIEELRSNLQLISSAIISEETTCIGLMNFIFTRALPEFGQLFQKGFESGKLEANDLLEQFHKMDKRLNEFWMNAVGKAPTRNDEKMKEAIISITEPFIKYMNELFKSSD